MLPVVAAASAVPAVGKALSSLNPFADQHPKDKGRIAANERAFALANSAAGNVDAFRYLRYRSGKFASGPVGPLPGFADTPGIIGGWASGGKGDEDAYAKYKQLATRYEAMENAGTDTPLPDQVVDPTNVGKAANVASIATPFLVVVVIGLLASLFMRPRSAGA